MKKMTKKAVTSTTAVKVEDKKATTDNSIKQKEVVEETTTIHISKTDPEWNDYIVGLKKNIDDALDAGLFNWYLAYVGFVDDPETGFVDLYDYQKMFRILVVNGYCPECAENYLEEFKNEVNAKGQKIHQFVITKEERDFWMMEDEYDEHIQSIKLKHMK